MIRSSRLLLRYETPLAIAPGPPSATKPPVSSLRRPPASSSLSPTFAPGPRGWQASTPWPSGVPCRDVGQRRAPGAATGGLGVGTTSPGRRARAERAAAKIGRVCLRARNRHPGRQGRKKTAAGRGDIRPPHEPRGTAPHGIAPRAFSQADAARSSEGAAREG